jgi:hypothetical protein
MTRGGGVAACSLALAMCLYVTGPALAAPSNDDFEQAERITLGAPVPSLRHGGSSEPVVAATSIPGDLTEATSEPGEPVHGFGFGNKTVWYRWTSPVDGLVRVDTCGAPFATVMSVYTGATLQGIFQTRVSDDASSCAPGAMVVFRAVRGTEYRVAVADAGTSSVLDGTFRITLRLQPFAPASPANDEPADAEPLEGLRDSSEASNTTATTGRDGFRGGAQSVWWAWRSPTDGRVQIDLCRSDFDLRARVYEVTEDGDWTLRALNNATCDVLRFKAHEGRRYQFAVGGHRADSGTVRLDLLAVPDLEPPETRFTLTPDAVHDTRLSRFDWKGDEEDFELNYECSLDDGRWYACRPPATFPFAEGTHVFRVRAIDAWRRPDPTPAEHRWEVRLPRAANDDLADAVTLATDVSVTANTSLPTAEPGEPSHNRFSSLPYFSVWYRWTAPATGRASIDRCGSDFRTVTTAYQGEAVDRLRRVAGGDFCVFSFDVRAGETYLVAIDGEATNATHGTGRLKLRIGFEPGS